MERVQKMDTKAHLEELLARNRDDIGKLTRQGQVVGTVGILVAVIPHNSGVSSFIPWRQVRTSSAAC
jgi:hypothetical protein